MAAFTYRAVDRGGKPQSGVLEAVSAVSARADLRARGLLPVAVAASRGTAGRAAGRSLLGAPTAGRSPPRSERPAGRPAVARLPVTATGRNPRALRSARAETALTASSTPDCGFPPRSTAR